MKFDSYNISIHLRNIFNLVRNFIINVDFEQNKNELNRDKITSFTIDKIKNIIIDYLFKNFRAVFKIITEFGTIIKNKDDNVDYTFIISEIDGLNNYLNKIRVSGFMISVFIGENNLNFENIEYAFIGNLYSNDYFFATKGGELIYNSKIFVKQTNICFNNKNIKENLLLMPHNRLTTKKLNIYNKLNSSINNIVSYNALSVEIPLIAKFKAMGYISLTKSIPLIKILPIWLLIKNVEGIFTDLNGNDIIKYNEKLKLEDKIEFIISIDEKIHNKLLKIITEDK